MFNRRNNFIYESHRHNAEKAAELERLNTILQYELLSSKSYQDDDVAHRRYHQSVDELRLRYSAKELYPRSRI